MPKQAIYILAVHAQAVGLVAMAWLGGDWLNVNIQKSWNWYIVTFPLALLIIAHSFYVVIKGAMKQK